MTPYAVWTEARLKELKTLMDKGLAKRDIAKAMRLTPKQVEKAAHKKGWYFTRVPKPPEPPKPPREFNAYWQWLLYEMPTPTRSHA